MDDARALAGRLRAMAAEPWKHDGGSWPDPMREAADLIDRLAAPEGVGLTTTAHERNQWRYSANPFTVEDKERLLRDFNRVVASLLKSNMERQAAEAERDALKAAHPWPEGPFAFGDRVEKAKGSSWHGQVCGWYTTSLTPIGYCVESEREPGSVQLYPAAALAPATSGEG